jgi:hypothetical protein
MGLFMMALSEPRLQNVYGAVVWVLKDIRGVEGDETETGRDAVRFTLRASAYTVDWGSTNSEVLVGKET